MPLNSAFMVTVKNEKNAERETDRQTDRQTETETQRQRVRERGPITIHCAAAVKCKTNK